MSVRCSSFFLYLIRVREIDYFMRKEKSKKKEKGDVK